MPVARILLIEDEAKTARLRALLRRATPLDNVLDVHIARLRRKVDDGFGSRLIHTIRGVGFALREDRDA